MFLHQTCAAATVTGPIGSSVVVIPGPHFWLAFCANSIWHKHKRNLVWFVHTDMHDFCSTDLHACANMCSHALVRVWKCVCWEFVVVLFNFKDSGTLCCVRLHADRLSLMNNYLQQCKTNQLIMMHCWEMFRRDSPRCLLCSTFVCVTQGFMLINKNATFYLHPVGCSLVAYSPTTVREHLSREDNCSTSSLQSYESGTGKVTQWVRQWFTVRLCGLMRPCVNKQHTLLPR